MTKKIKWGIISTGHISQKFAEALAILPQAELVAVASRTEEKQKNFLKNTMFLKLIQHIRNWQMILILMLFILEHHTLSIWKIL